MDLEELKGSRMSELTVSRRKSKDPGPALGTEDRVRGDRQPSLVDRHVGARVRARRKQLGLSQDRLAEALGLTFQQVQKYERGANRISASKLFDAAAALQVEVPFFFEGLTSEGGEAAAGQAPAPEPASALNAEETALLSAFRSVPGDKVRRRVLNLVRTLVDEADQEA